MKRFIKVRNYGSSSKTIRMVNQPEIVDYIKNNPGESENQIMEDVYGFYRGGHESNKKYADCLRRALHSGKIRREEVSKNRFVYYINDLPKVEPKNEVVYSSQIKNDNMSKIKLESKLMVLSLSSEVQVGPLKVTLIAMVHTSKNGTDVDFTDIEDVTYNGVPVSDYRKFFNMNKEFGIDYDQILNAEFEKIFNQETVKEYVRCQKINPHLY